MSLVLATLAGLVLVAPNAFAHHPGVSGVSSCLDDGSYQVTWTVADSGSTTGRHTLICAFSVTSASVGQAGTTTGLVANSAYIGLVTASAPSTGPHVAPAATWGRSPPRSSRAPQRSP